MKLKLNGDPVTNKSTNVGAIMESKVEWKEEMLDKSTIFQYVRKHNQLKATLRSLMTEWLVWVEGPGVYKSEHFFCLNDAKAWATEQLMVLGKSSSSEKK